MSDSLTRAHHWPQAEAPLIWLLGKTQAGKTSIVAEITGQGHDQIGDGYAPVTRTARAYAFPEDLPLLRFLDTRGLSDVESYDPRLDLEQARAQAHLLLLVVRIDDLELEELLAVVRETRKLHPEWPLLVAQSCLHLGYPRRGGHLLPYSFTGSEEDTLIPGLPDRLRQQLLAQRRLFRGLSGPAPYFIPIDFTQPEQGLPPSDYGAKRLWAVLEEVLPETVARLRPLLPPPQLRIRQRLILPFATAAAATNAVPVPLLGGLGSASLQAVMVTQIARRLGLSAGDHWRELMAALGGGFALGFGASWTVQQGLKLGLGWGTALVASWTFAMTWAIGEVALYYFGERVAGRIPEREVLITRYRAALGEARAHYLRRRDGEE